MTMIATLLEQRTGQQIGASRAWRLESALKPILRGLGVGSVDDLVSQLIVARDGALSDQVVDALLNQESSFFRDAGVLDLVADAAVAMRGAAPARRLRIWSSGCSTGQEPLSLAMLMHERGLGEDAVEIVATDVSVGAIARARTAQYSQFEIQRGLSVHRMMTWFDGEGADWTARRDLVRRIQYRQQNLVSDPPPAGAFDLILCRNVLLYFSAEVRRQVFANLARAARPGGLLVLGAGETVIGQTDLFAPAEAWRGLYRRADVSA
ncbi:MAG: protein-glutamate O-methyltransferase CheR [Pseudomonadota bacterium]